MFLLKTKLTKFEINSGMKNKCKEKSSIVRKHEESVEESIGKKSKERLKN